VIEDGANGPLVDFFDVGGLADRVVEAHAKLSRSLRPEGIALINALGPVAGRKRILGRQFGCGPVGGDGRPDPFCGGSRSGGNQRDRLKGQAVNGPAEGDKALDNSVAQPNIG
jgi:hypothetical protein